jgi:hypothetical protein
MHIFLAWNSKGVVRRLQYGRTVCLQIKDHERMTASFQPSFQV